MLGGFSYEHDTSEKVVIQFAFESYDDIGRDGEMWSWAARSFCTACKYGLCGRAVLGGCTVPRLSVSAFKGVIPQ